MFLIDNGFPYAFISLPDQGDINNKFFKPLPGRKVIAGKKIVPNKNICECRDCSKIVVRTDHGHEARSYRRPRTVHDRRLQCQHRKTIRRLTK